MNTILRTAVKTILAGTALSMSCSAAFAAGGVTVMGSSAWSGGSDAVGANSSIQTNTAAMGSNKSWTDNNTSTVPSGFTLYNDAWGHTGTWYSFDVTAANQNVSVLASVVSGNYDVAFTVWASGNSPFDGGTNTMGTSEISMSGSNPAHDFNQVSQVGSYGTVWATDPSVPISQAVIDEGAASVGGGNLLDTLAYANSGMAHTDPGMNGYGQVINDGINQVATDNTYFSGAVSGYVMSSDGTGGTASSVMSSAELMFTNLAPGWYTIFIGGADAAQALASTYNITITTTDNVSAVPLPGAVYLFGSALAGLAATGRRKPKTV